MKYFLNRLAVSALSVAATLLASGILAFPFLKMAKKEDSKSGVSMESVRAATGAGALFAVLGGYRTIAADLVWIKGYVLWEKKDLAGCVSSMELATEIDPYALDFWYEAAGIIAFDTPHWIFEKDPKMAKSAEFQKRIKERQAKLAISYIDRALKIFPDSDKLWIRKGQIAMIYSDWPLASECYSIPANKPNSMIYVRRIYAATLARQGKYKESLSIFEKLYDEVESDSPLKPVFKEEISKLKKAIEKTSI